MPDIRVYIAATLGELGLVYRLAPIGSWRIAGDPWRTKSDRADQARRAVLHGPHVWNFASSIARSTRRAVPNSVADEEALVVRLGEWLASPAARQGIADAASKRRGARRCLKRTLAALDPYLMQLRLEPRES